MGGWLDALMGEQHCGCVYMVGEGCYWMGETKENAQK